MKYGFVTLLSAIITINGMAQKTHIGIFGGLAAYNGDLTETFFPKKVTNGAIGVSLSYELTSHLLLRGSYTYAIVGGADRFNKDEDLRLRNLAFETALHEFSVIGEYNLLDLEVQRYSPYFFAGLAVFRFNPYAFDASGQKVFLQPLGTEGQGLPGYAEQYKLTQLAIPAGIGFRYAISDKIRVGMEGGLRKLFTDYLDDVSTEYADEAELLAGRGQLAVDMSYRSDEVGGSPVYPAKGAQRGGAKVKDYYYFTGIHLTYRLGAGNGNYGGKKNRMGCPTNIY